MDSIDHHEDYALAIGPSFFHLGDVLPDSLRELIIISSERYIRGEANILLGDQGAAFLEDVVVVNRDGTYWFSRKNGEGGVDPMKALQRGDEPL